MVRLSAHLLSRRWAALLPALALASTFTASAAAAHLAVLHPDPQTGQALLLPLPLPLPPAGQDVGASGKLEALQDMLAPAVEAAVQACRVIADPQGEDKPLRCPLPAALVAAHYGLATTPTEWRDRRGRRHAVQGGLYFSDAAGGAVAFVLAGRAAEVGDAGTVLSSDGSARFLRPHAVPAAAWKAWPELAAHTQAWARDYTTHCPPAQRCPPAPKLLGRLDRLRGGASEYRLASGARLQMLGASARPQPVAGEGAARAFVMIRLWRWQGADGRARQISDESRWFSSVELESESCETQCSWQWDSQPEVFEFAGRSFVFGAFVGGTVHGYQLAEVLPHGIRPLGGYRWGS